MQHFLRYGVAANRRGGPSAALRTTVRCGSLSSSTVWRRPQETELPSAEALTRALDALSLPATASDAEVRRSFRELVKVHHPDAVGHRQSSTAGEVMAQLTASYRLLQGTSVAQRRSILRGVGRRARATTRFTGQSDFTYTEAEYAKAMHAYHGRQTKSADSGSSTANFNKRSASSSPEPSRGRKSGAGEAAPSSMDMQKMKDALRMFQKMTGSDIPRRRRTRSRGQVSQEQSNYTPWLNGGLHASQRRPQRRIPRYTVPLLLRRYGVWGLLFLLGYMCVLQGSPIDALS